MTLYWKRFLSCGLGQVKQYTDFFYQTNIQRYQGENGHSYFIEPLRSKSIETT